MLSQFSDGIALRHIKIFNDKCRTSTICSHAARVSPVQINENHFNGLQVTKD
jgi:hypothetical protein